MANLTTGGTLPAAQDPVVQAALAGDEGAFAELVERHRRELHVHCYRMLGSFEEAEDLAQETFLRAWRGRGRFEAAPGSGLAVPDRDQRLPGRPAEQPAAGGLAALLR
jgi:hypothetical protein